MGIVPFIVGLITGFLFGGLTAALSIASGEKHWMRKAAENGDYARKAILRCEEWQKWHKSAPRGSVHDLLAETDEEDE